MNSHINRLRAKIEANPNQPELDNALRHTPAGGSVALDVRSTGERVELRVSDTGEGIPRDQLASIFDRYYQVDRGEAGNAGGAGLGLAITRRLVELHGGHIQVESAPGQGTTFVLDLPAVQQSPSPPAGA